MNGTKKLQSHADKGLLRAATEVAFDPKTPEILEGLNNQKYPETGKPRYDVTTKEFAYFWAKLLQPRIEEARRRRTGSPHDVVADHGQQMLNWTYARFSDSVDLNRVVEYLHIGWRYGDALNSWYIARTTPARPSSRPDDLPALPQRTRRVA